MMHTVNARHACRYVNTYLVTENIQQMGRGCFRKEEEKKKYKLVIFRALLR
jgi:hypothetical protein